MDKTILLVDDNDDDITLTKRALESNDIANEILIARDGVEAMEILKARKDADELPALVLLDLNMPKKGGLDVLQEMANDDVLNLVPTVVLTTSDEEDDMVNSYTFGANAYVRKPVDFTKFKETVKQVGIFWLAINRSVPI